MKHNDWEELLACIDRTIDLLTTDKECVGNMKSRSKYTLLFWDFFHQLFLFLFIKYDKSWNLIIPQALTISQSVYILNIFISWETYVRNYILTSKFWLSLVWMLMKEPFVLKMLLLSDNIEGNIFFLLLSSRDKRFSKMLICSLFSVNSCDIPGTKYFSNISDNGTEQKK